MPDVSPLGVLTQLSNLPANTNVVDAVALNAIHNALQAKLDAAIAALDDLDEANFSLATQRKLGLTSGSQKGRQLVYHNGTGTRTSNAYGDLDDAADVVTGVYVPAGAIVRLVYLGYMKDAPGSVGYARAAIFVGGNQFKVNGASLGGPLIQAGGLGAIGSADLYQPIVSCPIGLMGTGEQYNDNATGDVATGMALASVALGGGITTLLCYIGAEDSSGRYHIADTNSGVGGESLTFAGGACEFMVDPANPVTVDIGVKYKSQSGGGTISVKQRKLWVEVVGF